MTQSLKSALARVDGEAWLRFFIAVAGLGLAFLSAVLSTLSRESGNTTATTLFATAALLLAALVGFTTVPYLAKRVAVRRVRDALDFEITREGMAYLGVALVIGVAALNTNNNLLFIVLASMLAAIVVSGFASSAVLRGLELEVSMPEMAFAGKPIHARIRLGNPRRRFPAFSVRVGAPEKRKKKTYVWEWRRSEFVFPRHSRWIRLSDLTLQRVPAPTEQPKIFEKHVHFTFVPACSVADAQVELTFPRRGRYSQETLSLATRFPFSFLTKSRRVKLARELLVYPAILESADFLDVLPMIAGEFTAFVRGKGVELYRIREHFQEDPARFVDWKATAKTGALKVREFTREDERRLRIVFDNSAPGAVSPAAYEHGVSLAASFACHFAEENVELSFLAAGFGGAGLLDDFLGYLSVVEPDRENSVLDSLPPSAAYNLIITGRKSGALSPALQTSSYVIYMES
ncbi:MAG TPA: DUF58 domain-containing protein [Candidatus Angelobacter sp.]|nr:DUF58 domain-containing protein [Candidatus Angelobacter sp.]